MQDCHRQLKPRWLTSPDADYHLLTLLFLAMLLCVLAIFGYTPTNDGEGYLDYARICLAEGQPYPTISHIYGQPYVWNLGIINAVALSLWLCSSLVPLLVVLSVMKALTALLIAKLAEHLFNHRTGRMALLLFMFYPNNWGQSTMLSSEIPMVFFALFGLWLLLRCFHLPVPSFFRKWSDSRYRFTILFLAGALLAVANWFRPVAMIYLASALVFLLLFDRRHFLLTAVGVIAGYACIIAIIGTGSYLRTGYFLYQSDTMWFNMAEATYETDTRPHYGEDPFPPGTARYIDDMAHKTAIECSQIWRERSVEWLRQHPWQYLAKVPSRLYYTYQNDIDNISAFLSDKHDAAQNYVTLPLSELATKHNFSSLTAVQWLALLATACYLFLIVSAFFSTIWLLSTRQFKSAFLPVFIVVAGSLALVLAVHGETRFKAPLIPFLFILASVGIERLSSRLKQLSKQQ